MSLETAIAENTSALRELLAVLQAGALAIQPEAASTGKKSGTGRSSAQTQTASDSSANSSTESTKADEPGKGADAGNAPPDAAARTDAGPATDGTAQSAETGAAVTYQAAADAVTKLARTKGRDAAIGVLKDFGVEKLPEVKADQYAAVVAACAKAMEG
ncbi:hypothetical protein [Castellaniella sp.]|uniref:hypothetical protein n=1 Tax=Castellaniella sp. TaxID=1955812 RepID=UPI002AFE0179|nr:hypothetical protein [Castellaniella sp.]